MFFHMVNWFRELVTTFSVEQDLEMRTKVVRRLKSITELEDLLEEWIIGMYVSTMRTLLLGELSA